MRFNAYSVFCFYAVSSLSFATGCRLVLKGEEGKEHQLVVVASSADGELMSTFTLCLVKLVSSPTPPLQYLLHLLAARCCKTWNYSISTNAS